MSESIGQEFVVADPPSRQLVIAALGQVSLVYEQLVSTKSVREIFPRAKRSAVDRIGTTLIAFDEPVNDMLFNLRTDVSHRALPVNVDTKSQPVTTPSIQATIGKVVLSTIPHALVADIYAKKNPEPTDLPFRLISSVVSDTEGGTRQTVELALPARNGRRGVISTNMLRTSEPRGPEVTTYGLQVGTIDDDMYATLADLPAGIQAAPTHPYIVLAGEYAHSRELSDKQPKLTGSDLILNNTLHSSSIRGQQLWTPDQARDACEPIDDLTAVMLIGSQTLAK